MTLAMHQIASTKSTRLSQSQRGRNLLRLSLLRLPSLLHDSLCPMDRPSVITTEL